MNSESIRERGVLYITRKWPPAIGGMETYSAELTKELERRLPLEVIALPGRSDGSPPGAAAIISFTFSAAGRYFRRKAAPAVLHVGDMAAWPLALLAWARSPRPAVVMSAHGTDVSFHRRRTLKGRLYGAYLRLGARLLGSATIIANSAATAAVAAETGWRTARVIPLATSAQARSVPQDHGSELLFAGRLVERKGCAWFVANVLPLLPGDIGLRVAGTIWSGAERSALDDPRVTYLGSLDAGALADEYRRSLCVVVPNIEPPSGEYEGFGLVAPEAAAAGGVVIAAETGGLVDAVRNGETGFLVPSGNAEAWARKIAEIAKWTRAERSEFIEKSMARSREVFSWSRVADDVIAVYEAALSSQSSGQPTREALVK